MNEVIVTRREWEGKFWEVVYRCGEMRRGRVRYIVVDRYGEDVSRKVLSIGEEYDIIDDRFLEYYKLFGRSEFLRLVRSGVVTWRGMQKIATDFKNERK